MKKSIGFDYKYDSDPLQRLELIEGAGFDAIYLHSQYNPAEYVDLIRNSSLTIESLHLPYKRLDQGRVVDSRQVNALWQLTDEADLYVRSLIREVEFAQDYGINKVVMHVTGGEDPPPMGETGVRNVEKVLNACEKWNVTLCLENLRRLDYLDYLFAELSSDRLMFCFDSGHANCMTKNVHTFPWENYQDRLTYLHLNDNDGLSDQHLIPFSGNINWESLIAKLVDLNATLTLTLEVRSSRATRAQLTEREYLEACFNSLTRLESILEG